MTDVNVRILKRTVYGPSRGGGFFGFDCDFGYKGMQTVYQYKDGEVWKDFPVEHETIELDK